MSAGGGDLATRTRFLRITPTTTVTLRDSGKSSNQVSPPFSMAFTSMSRLSRTCV